MGPNVGPAGDAKSDGRADRGQKSSSRRPMGSGDGQAVYGVRGHLAIFLSIEDDNQPVHADMLPAHLTFRWPATYQNTEIPSSPLHLKFYAVILPVCSVAMMMVGLVLRIAGTLLARPALKWPA